MALSRSVRVCFVLIPILFCSFAVLHAASSADATRITAVANVTLRELPAAGSPAVAQVPLGTEIVEAGPAGLDRAWIRVRLSDSREGWVQASLTRTLDPVWRWPVYDRIVADRLGRKGDSFASSAELVTFIERVLPEYTDADGRARMELARLRAVSNTLQAVPSRAWQREPYAAWVASRKSELVFDEPGRRWLLSDRALWETHARLATTSAADDLAWLAVTNGVSGDCAGRVLCYLAARNALHGEYLRRHPFGTRSVEALTVIKETADLLSSAPATKASFRLDRQRECGELQKSVETLIGAVSESRGAPRDAAIRSLEGVKGLCR
jgi:hypothetical protein